MVHWAVDGGVPGVVGLLSLLYDKRAGNAAIQNYPEGLFLDFVIEIFGHKKRGCRKRAASFSFNISIFMTF